MTDSVLLNMTKFTPIESKIVGLLSDGLVHPAEEMIRDCFDNDVVADEINLRAHLTNVRRKISSSGLLINLVIPNGRRGKGYQMCRRLHKE